MKSSKRLVIFALVITLFLTVSLRIAFNRPPVEQMLIAKEILSDAELARSPLYSPSRYTRALENYQEAMDEWRRQNSRFILFRNFDLVEDYAIQSASEGKEAIEEAIRCSADARRVLSWKISAMKTGMSDLEDRFANFPFNSELSSRMNDTRILMGEGIEAFRNSNYHLAREKLNRAEAKLNDLHLEFSSVMRDYFSSYDTWNKWVRESIALSAKRKEAVVIIDKMARE